MKLTLALFAILIAAFWSGQEIASDGRFDLMTSSSGNQRLAFQSSENWKSTLCTNQAIERK